MGVDQHRLRLYQLALAKAGRLALGTVLRTFETLDALRRRAPERVVIAPQDLRTADPTEASDIYAGHFSLAGQSIDCRGRSPFEVEPPSEAWAEALAGFTWLRHLGAADSALARANARALVDDFLAARLDRRGIATRPAVVARRLLVFLSQSPLVLDGADHAFYRRFMRALARGVRQLSGSVCGALQGEKKLLALIALAMAGLCLDNLGRLQRNASRKLGEELARQILPDGGHISRNPRVLVTLLTELLPLRQVYAARGVSPPPQMLGAIDRMMPMLRMFRHGEGSLALFNGMGRTQVDLIATLLAYDDTRSRAIQHAPHSGYERLEAEDLVLIADVGAPPPPACSTEAHAGCLSFELSVGRSRLIVNCGAPRHGSLFPLFAARSTAAHSTVTVGDTSSCLFAGAGSGASLAARLERWLGRWLGTPILGGIENIEVNRGAASSGTQTLGAAHDGYSARFGLVHQRRWRLDGARGTLDGEDAFIAADPMQEAAAATVRFHLHPLVRTSRSHDGHSVLMLLPDGQGWSFEAEHGTLSIEESVFLSAVDGARRGEQIVVTVDPAEVTLLRWRFSRLEV
ncbi:putative heparinase superfamily protein [Pseudochelatococcus lubricantis]|uniref:Heparinase superfamily protein n=1 Tax=Pseudochelatococcus lubricantis TaxID=1538102 RepID=A0ABX0V3C9_9HYPH|nr:putative heparinase superfamily protein [Pseudochelatococcus lubricantis]